MKNIAVIGYCIPGESFQIAQVLEEAFSATVSATVHTYSTLTDFLVGSGGTQFDVLVLEHSFSLETQDARCENSTEYLAQKISTLHNEDQLYADEASIHLLRYLRNKGDYTPIVIYTRNVRSAREDIHELFPSNHSVCYVVERTQASEAQLVQTIRLMLGVRMFAEQ